MHEVVFPRSPDGRRSSAALGRVVVADALRAVDPAAAAAAEREPDWRRGYLPHFRALIEAGLTSDTAAYDLAAAGLASVQSRMLATTGADDVALADALLDDKPDRALETVRYTGRGTPEREVTLPFHGELLRGDSLRRRLDLWVTAGIIEETCAEAVGAVAANPDWLDLTDQHMVVLGAGAEMGPLPALLGWGATVAGIDLPRSELWDRVRETAEKSAGTLIAPTAPAASAARGGPAGADLLTDLPAVAQWLHGLDGDRMVLGNYVYAPGADYVRLSTAVDALTVHLQQRRDNVGFAMLATPTDVFAVPPEAVAQSQERYHKRSMQARAIAAISGGRLLRPNYPYGPGPGVNDSLVPQQGPNYALAKRIQRWRATVARRDGVVSFSVAPPTRTKSVIGNRLLAAAYAGAHLFDVEVFAPATANKLMALLLVHQLRRPPLPAPAVWAEEAYGAAHGGLWRTAYQPRSALGLAAVRGLPSAVRTS